MVPSNICLKNIYIPFLFYVFTTNALKTTRSKTDIISSMKSSLEGRIRYCKYILKTFAGRDLVIFVVLGKSKSIILRSLKKQE